VGKEVKVTVHDPIDRKSAVIGKLVETKGEKDIVIEETEGDRVRIEKSNIAKAKLHIEV
ncbi:MAG: hypothetical protein ACE5JK_08115, partial [Candidatus Omnitrophota bacterium]